MENNHNRMNDLFWLTLGSIVLGTMGFMRRNQWMLTLSVVGLCYCWVVWHKNRDRLNRIEVKLDDKPKKSK